MPTVRENTVNRVLSYLTSTGNKAISLFSALIAGFLILYGGYVIYDNIYIQNYSSSWNLLQYKPEIIDDDSVPLSGSALAQINKDYRAWLTLYDTNIDYPVVQGKDDLYYASHDVFKKSSLTGALYLAAGNSPDFSDNYNLVYGHHMEADTLFGSLDKYLQRGYMPEHKKGVVVTRNAVYDFTVFAVMNVNAYDTMIYSVGNRNLADVLSYISSNSVYYNAGDARGAVKLLVLSTCRNATTDGRLVVIASMKQRDLDPDQIPDGGPQEENIVDPSVSSSSNPPTDDIADNIPPLARFFHPTGETNGFDAWALVNLICLILTIFLVLPLGHLRAKFRREKDMDKVNEAKELLREMAEEGHQFDYEQQLEYDAIIQMTQELKWRKYRESVNDGKNVPLPENGDKVEEEEFEDAVEELYYHLQKFRRRFRIGFVAESLVAIFALILFILTEDMRLPMILIDMWTPAMIILLAITWIIDVRFVRYRYDVLGRDEDELEKLQDELLDARERARIAKDALVAPEAPVEAVAPA